MHVMLSEHLKFIEEDHEVHGKHPEADLDLTPKYLEASDITEIGEIY